MIGIGSNLPNSVSAGFWFLTPHSQAFIASVKLGKLPLPSGSYEQGGLFFAVTEDRYFKVHIPVCPKYSQWQADCDIYVFRLEYPSLI